MIKRINILFDGGNKIVLYTARGSTTGINWYELTKKQLKKWGVKYHKLHFGKPFADVYIDNRGFTIEQILAGEVTDYGSSGGY